jgi:hypothetical protein
MLHCVVEFPYVSTEFEALMWSCHVFLLVRVERRDKRSCLRDDTFAYKDDNKGVDEARRSKYSGTPHVLHCKIFSSSNIQLQ